MPKRLPRVVEWNGKDLPKALRSLPEGRYVIEDITPTRKLSAAEDAGLQQALLSVKSGATIPATPAHAQLREQIRKSTTKLARRRSAPR